MKADKDCCCLRELLESWSVPREWTERMSTRWKAKLVPLARTRESVLDYVTRGVPVLLDDGGESASKCFEEVGGCALDYFCGTELNSLKRPKIAFLGGWGRPGSDFSDESYLSLIRSFSDVIDPHNVTPRNLQMFHREESSSESQSQSQNQNQNDGGGGGDNDENGGKGKFGKPMPVLPRKLKWPLPELLGDDETFDHGVVVDNATRLSQRGAVTWWHLDDGGEFVLQVGLPISSKQLSEPCDWNGTGKPIVKIFIFADKSYYKMIMQDLETNKTGRSACLDLLDTPTEYLPELQKEDAVAGGSSSSSGDEDDILPVFWVAPLLAGGYPLLSPPNVPHMVLTAQNCVMIEQRRISKLFLDEVEYFLRRAAGWNQPPIFYDFIQKDLQDKGEILNSIVKPLLKQVETYLAECGGNDSESVSRLSQDKLKIAVRICCSLKTLLVADFFPQFEEASAQISKLLDQFSDYLQTDHREKVRQSLVEDMRKEENGVYGHNGKSFFALVHEKGCPRWGPHRSSRADAMKDRKKLKRACMERKLHDTLVQMKREAA